MTSAPTTRASLLLRLRDSRDHTAWVEFVTLYEPVVYRLLRRHGLQDADAQELMQELFWRSAGASIAGMTPKSADHFAAGSGGSPGTWSSTG